MGILFLVFPFIPATNLFFRVGFVVAERVLYMPRFVSVKCNWLVNNEVVKHDLSVCHYNVVVDVALLLVIFNKSFTIFISNLSLYFYVFYWWGEMCFNNKVKKKNGKNYSNT